MEWTANPGKNVEIEVKGKTYLRHAVHTRFVNIGDSYIDLLEEYVRPFYREGDIISSSEKVIALCQGRVVTEEECKPGFWATVLARCVHQTKAGPGMGLPVKMQFAINHCGLAKVIWAAICAAVCKIFGKKGVFYDMLGEEVTGLDGFYGEDIPAYAHMGVRVPDNSPGVCDEVYEKTGMVMMIVDANDLNVALLGKGKALADWTEEDLLGLIRDNPAGQGQQLTPFILIREKGAVSE